MRTTKGGYATRFDGLKVRSLDLKELIKEEKDKAEASKQFVH